MYVIGACVKLSNFKGFKKNIYNLVIFIISMLTAFALIQLGNFYYINHLESTYYTLYPASIHFPLVIIGAIFFFIFFNNLSFENDLINKIAKTSFGIYLIHDNAMIRSYIWHTVFHSSTYAYLDIKIIYIAILTILIVFLISTIIDLIRIFLFDNINKLLISIKAKF